MTTSSQLDEAPDALLRLATEFADSIDSLLTACLPGAPNLEVAQVKNRVKIAPVGQTERSGGIPLLVAGERLAWLRLNYLCRTDTTDAYLAVDSSKIWIVAEVDRTPIFRFEYLYDADWVPHSHIQVHGQRGALSHLLSKTGHDAPHDMSALHLPTGGQRFRPSLEDVIQFLLADCKFDHVEGWMDAVKAARAKWRAIQVRAAARAMAEEAAAALVELGYTVTPPQEGHPTPGEKARFAW